MFRSGDLRVPRHWQKFSKIDTAQILSLSFLMKASMV